MRLCQLPGERLEKVVLNWDYDLCAQGKKTWCRDVKHLMNKCNLSEIYDSKNSTGLSLSVILQTVVSNLLLAYTDTWKVSVMSMPKLRTYGPRQANLVLIAYASSEGSGEPAHPRSLARTFAARSYKQLVKRNLQTESQIPGPSEWLGMRS